MPAPSQSTDALRILDANANRAAEGLRVVEDFVRFGMDDLQLAELCKCMRHRLRELLQAWSPSDRAAARDTTGDVGRDITTRQEYVRESPHDVAQASLKRVQQALRCIEEFAKTSASAISKQIESLRYESYTLEKAILATGRGREQLGQARLYVLIDGGRSPADFQTRAQVLVSAGVHVLQLRDKRLDDRTLLERARWLRDATKKSDALFIMNDRPDLALLAHADGVHLGQDELTVQDARRVMGVAGLVGVSTHSLEQARQAVSDGANYIGVGPMFASQTKSFERIPGPKLLSEVTPEIGLPVFAIGGIRAENLGQIRDAGGQRIAVSGEIWKAEDPAAATRRMLALLESNEVAQQ